MNWCSSFYFGLIVAFFTLAVVQCTELTFELEDNARQCFYEDLKKDVKGTLEFQVSTLIHVVCENCNFLETKLFVFLLQRT